MLWHSYKYIDTSFYFNGAMSSQSNNAQRDEGSAGSRPSVELSQAQNEYTSTHTPIVGNPGHAPRSRSKDFKELRQLGAVDFHGTTDPAEAEAWLKMTERTFTMMRCPREDWFDLAVSLLQGDAYDWWETVPGAVDHPLTLVYDDFLRIFRNKYTPAYYRDDKQREFLQLRQRTMTVAEYEVRFTQLSRYASALVATEGDLCRRFEDGLNYEIKSMLTLADSRSYEDLKAAAIRAE